jgi:hypothetical protein
MVAFLRIVAVGIGRALLWILRLLGRPFAAAWMRFLRPALLAVFRSARAIAYVLIVGALVLAFAFSVTAAAFAVLALVTGAIGWGAMRLERPLVNPAGPLAVPVLYALFWAVATTVALFLDSIYVNRFLGRPVDDAYAWLGSDARLFFAEAAVILCLAVLRHRSLPETRFTSSALLLLAAATFALFHSSLGEVRNALPFLYGLATDPTDQAQAWLQRTNGNLFQIGTVLPWIFLGLSLVTFIFEAVIRVAKPEIRRPLRDDEWRNFTWAAVVTFAMLAIIAWHVQAPASYWVKLVQWFLASAALSVLVYLLLQAWLDSKPEVSSGQQESAQPA